MTEGRDFNEIAHRIVGRATSGSTLEEARQRVREAAAHKYRAAHDVDDAVEGVIDLDRLRVLWAAEEEAAKEWQGVMQALFEAVQAERG